MKKLTNLTEVLAFQLEAMYHGEKQVQHQLPVINEIVQHPRLKEEITKYIERSVEKRCKLKRIFSYLLIPGSKRKNKVIENILNDAQDLADHASGSALRDVVLASFLQSINYYNVANYRAALALAIELNLDQVADILHEILESEKETVNSLEKITFEKLGRRDPVS